MPSPFPQGPETGTVLAEARDLLLERGHLVPRELLRVGRLELLCQAHGRPFSDTGPEAQRVAGRLAIAVELAAYEAGRRAAHQLSAEALYEVTNTGLPLDGPLVTAMTETVPPPGHAAKGPLADVLLHAGRGAFTTDGREALDAYWARTLDAMLRGTRADVRREAELQGVVGGTLAHALRSGLLGRPAQTRAWAVCEAHWGPTVDPEEVDPPADSGPLSWQAELRTLWALQSPALTAAGLRAAREVMVRSRGGPKSLHGLLGNPRGEQDATWARTVLDIGVETQALNHLLRSTAQSSGVVADLFRAPGWTQAWMQVLLDETEAPRGPETARAKQMAALVKGLEATGGVVLADPSVRPLMAGVLACAERDQRVRLLALLGAPPRAVAVEGGSERRAITGRLAPGRAR